jgi:hypothetical protein
MGRIDRRNRAVAALVGLLVGAGATLAACVGAGVFGRGRSDHAVFGPTLVGWWNEGGWKSFAVVVGIGVVAIGLGLWLALPQLVRNDALRRTQAMALSHPGDVRGETTLRAPALSHGLESDLERLPDVCHAAVGLFGTYPDVEMRAVIDVTDDADLDRLPDRVDDAFQRAYTTTGVRFDPIHISVRFNRAQRGRQLQ